MGLRLGPVALGERDRDGLLHAPSSWLARIGLYPVPVDVPV
jgi:hypothetical protein